MGTAFVHPAGKFFLAVRRVLLSGFGVFLMIYGCRFCYLDDFSGRGMTIATLFVIEGITLQYYAFGYLHNAAVDGIKQSSVINKEIKELYEAFQNVDTPMGRPWIGKVKNVEDDCLIYEPTDAGSFVFGYYNFGVFSFSEFDRVDMLEDPGQAAEHTVKVSWDRDDFGLGELYPPVCCRIIISACLKNTVKPGGMSFCQSFRRPETFRLCF